MPTIRIDTDVYNWLKSQAVPFEDTPNSVLRRIANLDVLKKEYCFNNSERNETNMSNNSLNPSSDKAIDGKYLNDLWNVNAKHSLYHCDGTWYQNLKDFPGALFDYNGYIIFMTKEEYESSPYLSITQQTNVPSTISNIPGYKRMRK